MRSKHIILYWLPSLLWMSVIFYLSSLQRVSVTEEFVFDFLIFKSLHVLEYGLLYFLILFGFYKTSRLSAKKILVISLLIALFYAATDELHQTFVPTREGKVRDVIIDAVGIWASYLFSKNKIKFINKDSLL